MANLIKYRPHRGSIDESMAEVVEIEAAYDAILAHITHRWEFAPSPVSIFVEKYGTYDTRIDWDTHIVMVRLEDNTVFPIGYTNGPIQGRLRFKHTDICSPDALHEVEIDATPEAILKQLSMVVAQIAICDIVVSKMEDASYRSNVFVKTETGLRKYGELDWPFDGLLGLVVQDSIGTITYQQFRTIGEHRIQPPIKVRATYDDLLKVVKDSPGTPENTTSITIVQQPESELRLVYAIGEHGYLPVGLINGPIEEIPKDVKSIYGISQLEIGDSEEQVLVPIQFLFQHDCNGNGFTSSPVKSGVFKFRGLLLELECVISASVIDHAVGVDVHDIKYSKVVNGVRKPYEPKAALFCTGYRLTLDLSAHGQGGGRRR